MTSINLKAWILRLSRWTRDVKSYSQRQTRVQVWNCLLDLPQEYRCERTIFEVFGVIGTTLIVDVATHNQFFGHYARILVGVFHFMFLEIFIFI